MSTYGVNATGIGGGPARFAALGEVARSAERAGCAAVWSSELYGRSATVPMAVMASATSQIGIGSAIAYGVGRSPLTWAAEARDLDELSCGRLILGLGNGTSAMMDRWHCVTGEAPAERMRELVTVLRKLWRLHEGPVDHDGRFYSVHITPTTDVAAPLRENIPIHLAGINPAMLRTVGAVADGLICHPMFTADYLEAVVRPALHRGASDAGRDVRDIVLSGIKICAIDDDEENARHQAAYAIGQYAASRVYDRLFELHGWSSAQQRIRRAARERDRRALIAAVPEAAIDIIAVAATPATFADRLHAASAGFDHVAVTAAPWGLTNGEANEVTHALIDQMGSMPALSLPALEL
jgi:probable F420-dependent oxidoreductase